MGVSVNQVVNTTGITFKLTAKDTRYQSLHSFETQDGTDRIPLPPPIDYEAKLMEEEAAKKLLKNIIIIIIITTHTDPLLSPANSR